MVANIVNLLSKTFLPEKTQRSTSIRAVSNNPFTNPFVSSENSNSYRTYAKNNPMQGGYFAGYYNGKANIVGQRLFIEA